MKNIFKISFFSFFILLLAGCAPTTKFVDYLGWNSKRGYVEFYCKGDEMSRDYKSRLFLKGINPNYLFTGKLSHKSKKKVIDKTSYIITKPPGYYYISTVDNTCYFEIQEDMVTPVKVRLVRNTKKLTQPWGIVEDTQVKVFFSPPEEPVPIEDEKYADKIKGRRHKR